MRAVAWLAWAAADVGVKLPLPKLVRGTRRIGFWAVGGHLRPAEYQGQQQVKPLPVHDAVPERMNINLLPG
jgi:hypothetical protein